MTIRQNHHEFIANAVIDYLKMLRYTVEQKTEDANGVRLYELSKDGIPFRGTQDGLMSEHELQYAMLCIEKQLKHPEEKFYFFYWLTHDMSYAVASSPEKAMAILGYSHGSLGALDFYEEGRSTYILQDKKWVRHPEFKEYDLHAYDD